MRTRALLAVAGLLATALSAVGLTTPAADAVVVVPDPIPFCSDSPSARPCVVSATKDGVDLRTIPNWGVDAFSATFPDDPSTHLSVDVTRGGGFDLGSSALDDVVVVSLHLGTSKPSVVSGNGRDTDVVRTRNGDGTYDLTVTGTPVTVSGQCDQSVYPWVCPEHAANPAPDLDTEWSALYGFDVTDYAIWEDPAQRAAFYGMDYFTNIAATSLPPEIANDADGNGYLLIRMANRRFREDGSTLVQGHSELRIPNAFLREVYGIPDPATLGGSGLATTVSGGTAGAGTVEVSQEPGGGAMLVDLSGVRFTSAPVARAAAGRAAASSMRLLKVRRGVVTPTAPKATGATRTAARTGRVTWAPARARGAKVTGYVVRCVPRRGSGAVQVTTGVTTRTKVGSLRSGVAYDCRVKARSKAGSGRYGAATGLAARP